MSENEEKPQKTPQELALDQLVINLESAINSLVNATVNIQTFDPRLTGVAKAFKETVGDLTVSRAMLASRRKESDG